MYDHFSMKKRRAPFFGPMDSFRVYRGSAIDLQSEAKKQGSIGVEITEPIVRPISYQDFAKQNEANRTGSLGLEIQGTPLTPDRPQVKRPPPSLQITSNFLDFMGFHMVPLLKRRVWRFF